MLNDIQAADLMSSLTALFPLLRDASLTPRPPRFEVAPASNGVVLRVTWQGDMYAKHVDTGRRGILTVLETHGYLAEERPSLRGPRGHAAWLVRQVASGQVAA